MVCVYLRDDQFERIAALLPGEVSDPGRTAADYRLFVEAVLWIARTGSPWCDLPAEFGPWNSVYQRFARWSRKGLHNLQPASLSADKAYDTDAILDYLAAHAIEAVIPPPSHRTVQRPFNSKFMKQGDAESLTRSVLPPATTNSPSALLPSSLFARPSYGWLECQQTLDPRALCLSEKDRSVAQSSRNPK